MCICVEKLISSSVGQRLGLVNSIAMGNNTHHQRNKLNMSRNIYKYGYRKIQERGIFGIAIPDLSQSYILRYERATLIDSSTIAFGNECMRLVNIVFHTSQMFPSMMGTCDRITQYLRKELLKTHSTEHFHIIIGKNNDFSFAISDYDYFAEIKQEQYRVLIFSTESHGTVKVDTHSVNNQMKLEWNSVVIKQAIPKNQLYSATQ